MSLKYISFLSLLVILTLVLFVYLQIDFNIKKTNSDIYKLTKAFSYELDENLQTKGSRFLGDQAAIEQAMAQVASQGKAAK